MENYNTIQVTLLTPRPFRNKDLVKILDKEPQTADMLAEDKGHMKWGSKKGSCKHQL